MSRRFSIFTKMVALLLVLAISMAFMQEAQAYHCDQEEDDYWDEMKLLGALGLAASAACSPPSLATGYGALACAGAMIAYLLQADEVQEAKWAWDACKREHDPN